MPTKGDTMAPISSRFLSFALVGLGVVTISLTPATAQAASADLAVTIAVPATVPAGSTVTFVATVTNNGPNSAQAVVMTTTVPPGVMYFGTSDTGSTPFTGGSGPPFGSTTGTIQGTVTTLPAGASASAAVSITFEVPPTTPVGTVISFSGTASSSTPDPNPSNNTGTASTTVTAAVGGTADVAVTMIAPTIAPPGSNARYAVTVTNNGPNDAQSVVLTGATPAGVTYAGASLVSGQKPTGGNVPATGGTGAVSMGFASLAPGASSTMAFTFQVSSNPSLLGQVISYTMSASSNTADPTPANNTFTASTTIGTPPQLVITSTSPLPACTVGVAYSFQFTASGGAGGYLWQFLPGGGSGLLPDGLLLSPSGLLSGIPTGGPDSSFVVQVTDGVGIAAQASFAYHIYTTPPLTITTPSPLPAGTVGVTYSLQFTATGGVGGNTWSVSHGSAGNLLLSPSGLLSGTPMGSGDLGFGVKVTDSASHTAEGSFTLHISPAASNPYATWVPVASHASGLNQSQWRSDLGLFNTGMATANVQLSFYGSGGVVTNTVYVPAGTQSILTDVVGQIGGSGSGAIQILSDQSLKVTARTYNQVSSSATCYAGGTQGQDYPTGAASGGLSAGQSAYLAGLTENASYHCNIGVVDVGSGAATVLVELFNGAGSKLTDYTVNLTAGQWSQATQPFKNLAGQTAMDRGYAKITVQSGSGVFGFASVIDNITNDPTTVAMQTSALASAWVPVASHASGLNQSQWRSDLGLLNTGTVTANVHLSFYGSVPFVVGPFLVPAGTQSILTDVVGQIGGSGSGAIQIVSDQPLQVTARSYNQVSSTAICYPNGTQGQDYPAVTANNGLPAQQSAYLAGLTENASYHCNIGVVNVGSSSATVVVDLFDAVGTALANYTVSLAAGQWAQATQPFKNAAGQTAMDRGYARITVQSGSGVFGFASVIDNITNDPTTVAMQR